MSGIYVTSILYNNMDISNILLGVILIQFSSFSYRLVNYTHRPIHKFSSSVLENCVDIASK